MKQTTSTAVVFILSILIVISLVLLFAPYYTHEGTGVSLLSYTWFPSEHTALAEHISSLTDGRTVNDILGCTVLIPLCGIACFFLLWNFRDNLLISSLTGIWSLWGFIWYAKNPMLRLTSGMWITFLLLFAAACAVSIVYSIMLWCNIKSDKENIGENEVVSIQ